MKKTSAREVKTTDASAAIAQGLAAKPKKATRGVKAGLAPDESRITCIFKDDQNQLLHDWCRTTEQSFKAVCLAMADLYIDQIIRQAAAEGAKVKRSAYDEPPAQYADLYDEKAPDKYAKYRHE